MGSITFEAFLDDIPQMEEFFLTHPELFIPDPDNPDDQDDLAKGCEIVRALNDAAKNQELGRGELPIDLLLLLVPTQCRVRLNRRVLSIYNIYQKLNYFGGPAPEKIDNLLGVERKSIFRLFEDAEPSDQEYEAGCRQLRRLADLLQFTHFDLDYCIVPASMPPEWEPVSLESSGDRMFIYDDWGNPVSLVDDEPSDEKIERCAKIMERIPKNPAEIEARKRFMTDLRKKHYGCEGDCSKCRKHIC